MLGSLRGFTMIEMVIAILIGSILTTIALTGISSAQSGYAARGAKSTYQALHARARAHGIEKGEGVRLHLDANGDSAWIDHGGDILETIRFGGELNVDVRINATGSPTSMRVCFTPRGYADPNCNSPTGLFWLEFWRGADSTRVLVLPMGQLLEP